MVDLANKGIWVSVAPTQRVVCLQSATPALSLPFSTWMGSNLADNSHLAAHHPGESKNSKQPGKGREKGASGPCLVSRHKEIVAMVRGLRD